MIDNQDMLRSPDFIGNKNFVEQGCSIINLSSISAHRAQPNRWTYSATKGAILTVTRCMALDLRAKQIRVNSVSPGYIWTPEVGICKPRQLANPLG